MKLDKFDESGNRIWFEGVRDNCSTLRCNCMVYSVVILLSLGLMILVLPCLIACTCVDHKIWKLYLTRTHIHYSYGCEPNQSIALDEINGIHFNPGTRCNPGWEKTITIVKKKGDLVTVYEAPSGNPRVVDTRLLHISHVANGEEFVEAVRQRMFRPGWRT